MFVIIIIDGAGDIPSQCSFFYAGAGGLRHTLIQGHSRPSTTTLLLMLHKPIYEHEQL